MRQRHAICLVVDGLRASALGTYGNTSYSTPNLDAFASESVVIDWLWADTPEQAGFYRSVWEGQHALRPPKGIASLPHFFHSVGLQQWLVTDDPWLTSHSIDWPFDKSLLMESATEDAAPSIEETLLAQLFSETILQLDSWLDSIGTDQPSLLWLHARGLTGPWDAPKALREQFWEEGDLPPLEFVNAPAEVRNVEDPDEIHAFRMAYASQVAVLDACLGAFVAAMEEVFSKSETLLMLFGSRGYALGEHGAMGSAPSELFNELMHLPWLLKILGEKKPQQRYPALTQPADIAVTLLDWFNLVSPHPVDGQSLLAKFTGVILPGRQIAVSRNSSGEQSLLTPDWYLRKPVLADDSMPATELYVKPDDRWEHNDVADRCPEVVERLSNELAEFERHASNQQSLPTKTHDSSSKDDS